MIEEQFILKAKEYLQEQLGISHNQWEYDGALNFGKISTIIDITAKLDDKNPNVRIQATRVLRLYHNTTNIDYVLDCLSEHLNDKEMNRVYSEFQCEENEIVYVAEEVKKTIDTLKQRV